MIYLRNLLLLMTCLLFILPACGSESGNTAGDGGTSASQNNERKISSEPVTLKIGTPPYIDDETLKTYITDPVTKKYPNISFQTIILKGANAATMQDLISAGENPDIIVISSKQVGAMTDVGYDLDIEPLIKLNKLDLSRFEPVALEAAKVGGRGEHLTGLPFQYYASVLLYNKEIFDRFAAPYPKDGLTWDDARELAKKVTREDGGAQYRGLEPDLITRPASALNPLYFTDHKTNRAALSTDTWKHVFSTLKSIYDIPGNSAKLEAQAAINQFVKDQTLAMLASINGLVSVKDATFQWDISTYPSWPEKPHTGVEIDATLLTITKVSQHKDAAFQVLDTVTSDEVQKLLSSTGHFPSVKSKAVIDVFAKDVPYAKGKNLAAISKVTPAPPLNKTIYDDAAQKYVKLAFEKVLNGTDINTALREADDAINQDLDALKQK